MKTVEQIMTRIDGQIDSLDFAIKSSTEETPLKLKREGAKSALEELKKFIMDTRWKE